MELPRFGREASSEDVAQALRDAGCAVIDQLAPHELMDQVGSELEPFVHATPFGLDDFTGTKTKRTGSLISRAHSFHQLASHPTVVGAAKNVICQTASSMQIHLTQIIDIGPKADPQPIHRSVGMGFLSFPSRLGSGSFNNVGSNRFYGRQWSHESYTW